MGTITRKLADSNPQRRKALKSAKIKRTSSPIATDVLRASTILTLDTAQPAYEGLCVALDNAIPVSALANAIKDAAQTDLHLWASHYIMVFNLAIRRGLIPKEERGRLGLDINSDALPPMDSETDLRQVAETIVTADAARVLAGGMAMSNPSAAEVASRLTLYLTKLDDASEKKDLLDAAQEALNDAASGVDPIILRIWDEVESYFNNESPESKRANAREWGVVYVSVGSPTDLQLTVLLAGGAPAVNYPVRLVEGRVTRNTDAAGKVEMTTTLNGELDIEVQLSADPTNVFETTITVIEGVTFVGTIQLV